MQKITDVLNYAASHPDAKILYFASDMILNVHSNMLYLSESDARSQATSIYFLGKKSSDPSKPPPHSIVPNDTIHDLSKILSM